MKLVSRASVDLGDYSGNQDILRGFRAVTAFVYRFDFSMANMSFVRK